MFTFKAPSNPLIGMLLLAALLLANWNANAQCTPTQRAYANTQTNSNKISVTVLFVSVTLAEVQNKANAIDNDVNTASTLYTNVGLLGLGTAWQTLKFDPADLPAGDNGLVPVSVKLGIGSTILNVLNSIKLQATFDGTPVGTVYTGTSLLGLLGGQGESIATFVPGAKYNGVRVLIDPVVDIGTSVDLYYAFFEKSSSLTQACTTPIEVLSGSTGTIASSLVAVENPARAVDGNTSTTYAKINATVSALNETYIAPVYPSLSTIGDSVRIILEADNLQVLNATVLSSLNVVAYNGTSVAMSLSGTPLLLHLSLFGGSSTKYSITFPITAPFNKLSVAIGGAVTALNGLRIYEIQRIMATPKITSTDMIGQNIALCQGNTSTLSISNAQSCTKYNWYNVVSGGSILTTATSYTPPIGNLVLGDNIYYVEAIRDYCTETSGRIPVTLTINALPTITLGAGPSICQTVTATTLPFTATTANPISYSISWSSPSLTNVVNATFPATSPITLTVPNNISAATYTGTLTVKNANNCSSAPLNFSLTIKSKLPIPSVSITSN